MPLEHPVISIDRTVIKKAPVQEAFHRASFVGLQGSGSAAGQQEIGHPAFGAAIKRLHFDPAIAVVQNHAHL